MTNNMLSELEQSFFENLGSFVCNAKFANANKKTFPELSKKMKYAVSRNIAKVAAEGLSSRADADEFQPSILVLEKVANTKDEDWTSFHDDVVDGIVKSAASIVGSASTAASLGLKGLTPVIGTIPALAAASIPLTGMTLGTGLHGAERAINEDELETEKLKALIVKYKQMTAKLEREVAAKLEEANS